MKAENKPNYDNNRSKLADIIPLDTPFTVYIEQTRYCNFKCFYCIHSTRDDEYGEFKKLGYDIKSMSIDTAKYIVNELKKFPNKLKRIVFSGLGEPLANPNLPEIIEIFAKNDLSDRIEVITNGLFLNKELIDKLTKSGLTNINISIQGISSQRYFETCGVKVDIDNLIENLTYLYNNKDNIQIYIKAIDDTLKSKEEEDMFYKMFGNICDRIYIEHLIVMQQSMDENLSSKVDKTKNFYGEYLDDTRKVCSQSFYFMQIGCDGDIFPCPVPGLPRSMSMGNINENSIVDIWNGDKRKEFLLGMLRFEKDKYDACKNCTCFNAINNPLEYLDNVAYKVIDKLERSNK